MQQPLKNLEFYGIHTSANGPAMTSSILAINVAQVAVRGCATWSYLLASSIPYVSHHFTPLTIDSKAILPVLGTGK